MRVAAIIAIVGAAAASSAQDLNGNFQQDSLERRNGAADCNHNGFIDLIDVARPHFGLAAEHLNGLEQFMSEVYDACPIDFELDGDMDLATISHPDPNYGYLNFWRNDGGPGLTFVLRRTIGLQLGSIRTADLNGDGRGDLVISDTAEERVYVLLATGPGTFGNPATLIGDTSVNGTGALALGDLDLDGDVDIVSPQFGTRTVCVYRNNGAGVFGPKSSFPADYTPWAAAIGDVTGDGLPDIAVANNYLIGAPVGTNGTVTILRNTGPSFAAHATLAMPTNSGPFGIMRPQPRDVLLRDTDHDGDLDLIVSSDGSQRLDLFTNNGTGTFTFGQMVGAAYYLDSAANKIACADLDGDGWEELAWTDTDAHAVSIFKNTEGVFTPVASYTGGTHTGASVAAADFTGDGRPELVTSNSTLRTFSIMENLGGLNFDTGLRFRPAQYPSQAMLGDFTGDGLTDMAFMLQTQTAVQGVGVYAGIGGAKFSQTPILTTNPNITSYLRAIDVNADGRLDLVELVGRCNVYLGNGNGTFQPAIVNPVIVFLRNVLTDINLDGHVDIVWISPGHPGALLRSLGDGSGHFGPAAVVGVVPAEDESIAFGDLNEDGAPEIFTGHRQFGVPGGVLSVYPNNTDGTFGARQDRFIVGQPLSPAVAAIACADFDLDGDNDVVVSANGLRLYRNAGDGSLPELPETVSNISASMLTVADINLDGAPDLYARANAVMAVLGTGTGGFLPAMILPFMDSNARWMVVNDLDNDGRPDVLVEPENSWDKYAFLNHAPASRDVNANGMPDECEPGLSCDPDVNCDGVPDQDDVACIILAVAGDMGCFCQADADFNGDGVPDQGDVADVILVVAGAPCP